MNGVIAKLVQTQRERLGISLAALAKASGVPLSTVEGLELGADGCSAVDLWRIARALEAPISELCGPNRLARITPSPRSFAAEDTSDSDHGGAVEPLLLGDQPKSATRQH